MTHYIAIIGDIIESKHRHDFVRCRCGSIYVDGGQDYQRCGWSGGDMEDLIDFSYLKYKDNSMGK